MTRKTARIIAKIMRKLFGYNDDEVMNEKINNGYSLYINQDIDKYIKLIELIREKSK